MEEIKLTYTENDFLRIDKYLSNELNDFTRTQLQLMIDEKLVIAKLEQCRDRFDEVLSTKRVGGYNVTKYVRREHMNRFLTMLIEYVEGLKVEDQNNDGNI